MTSDYFKNITYTVIGRLPMTNQRTDTDDVRLFQDSAQFYDAQLSIVSCQFFEHFLICLSYFYMFIGIMSDRSRHAAK